MQGSYKKICRGLGKICSGARKKYAGNLRKNMQGELGKICGGNVKKYKMCTLRYTPRVREKSKQEWASAGASAGS